MDRNFIPDSGSWIFLLLLTMFISQSAWAEKTDVVYLKNGDRITGEVKSLGHGKLEFSTDHMGKVSIEWEDILHITSKKGHSVQLTNGQRYYGALVKLEQENMIGVSTPLGMANVGVEDIFAMYPVEAGFWDRLDLSVDLGVSWDKGSDVGKYSLGMDAKYRRTQSLTQASFISEITTQGTTDNTQRTTLSGIHNVFRPNKKFHSYFANLESNDELGVELRALAGAGYGWAPWRSQRNWFSFALGLDINHETPTAGETETNLEGVGWLTYEYYKFNSPKRSFKTNFVVFPSLTDWGRWRMSFATDFRFELVSDLFWKMSLYASYDTASLSTGDASSDYGLTSSLGYKF